ncbi:MAG: hypothetical protein GC159_11080 [Phycisphaera sp.]|nr:hypothetical protein [Phycisphaera sp.]
MVKAVVAWVVLAATGAVWAGKTVVDPPLKVLTYDVDNKRLAGYMTAYDARGFDLKDAKGKIESVGWARVQPRNIYVLQQRAFGDDANAEQWLGLGALLLNIDDETAPPLAERAFREALKKDDKVGDIIARIKAESRAGASHENDGPDGVGGADGEAAVTGAFIPDFGGASLSRAWPDLSDAQTAAAIEDAKTFAERTKQQINDSLRLYETKYFLFYTDLDDAEARKWQGLMDKMYARLIEMFALEKGRNIWKGKALVFVFQKASDYQKFQITMHHTNPGSSAGMCHSFSNGDVHIAFYRDENEMRFAHVMVHETVHGFVHRYKSPVPVLSWVNEGLAEWLSMELLPNYRSRKVIRQEAAEMLFETGGSLRGMLAAQHIQPWQYGVATSLTDFMIEYKRRAYVEFIQAIKSGKPWEDAFEHQFGMPIDKFLVGFGRSMKIDAVTR